MERQLLQNELRREEMASLREWATRVASIAAKRRDELTEQEESFLRKARNRYVTEHAINYEGSEREQRRQMRSFEKKQRREDGERDRRAAIATRIIPLAVSWRRDGEEMVFKFDSRGKVMKAGAIMRGEENVSDELTEEEKVTLKEEGCTIEFCYLRFGQFGPIWAETLREEEEALKY